MPDNDPLHDPDVLLFAAETDFGAAVDECAQLSTVDAGAVIDRLRTGEDAFDVADDLGLPIRSVYITARTNTDLALALAGKDPHAYEAEGDIGRAEYLRLLALGCSPTLADRILFDGAARATKWRSDDPNFGVACDVVASARAKRSGRRTARFTPSRIDAFLNILLHGHTVVFAAAEVGVTSALVYQRRRRDAGFKSAMDEARALGQLAAEERETIAVEKVRPEQWEALVERLRAGVTLRRAGMDCGVAPDTIYARRKKDPAFRELTDLVRGVPPSQRRASQA